MLRRLEIVSPHSSAVVGSSQLSSSARPSAFNGTRNKGGRPLKVLAVIDERKQRNVLEATNWVVAKYAEAKKVAMKQNRCVRQGERETLVATAKTMFQLEGCDFDVGKALIYGRIKNGRLREWV